MSNIIHYINFFKLPPKVLFKRLKRRFLSEKSIFKLTSADGLTLNSLVDVKDINSNIPKKQADYFVKKYIAHEFNLLGSGWVLLNYNTIAFGVEGYMHKQNKTAPDLGIENYNPIDWQKDFKSGFRWDETLSHDKQYGLSSGKLGADIKVPWELGRLQHLPRMAVIALQYDNHRQSIIQEFKNQLVDFMKSNRVGYGVNWTSSMDIGIRVSNILLAYDILKQIDTEGLLGNVFETELIQYIYHHAEFINQHLEDKDGLANNHYLYNLGGLLFVSSYLKGGYSIDAWKKFSVAELEQELYKQFFSDGGNFEGSTAYHNLGTELYVWCTALLLNSGEKVSAKWQNYLSKMCAFSKSMLKSNNEVPQFGDNDSGRFFNITPKGSFISNSDAKKKYKNLANYSNPDDLYWDENYLEGQKVIDLSEGLFGANNTSLEASVIKSIAKIPLDKKEVNNSIAPINTPIPKLKFQQEKEFTFDINLMDGLELIQYPDFGLYIFKSKSLYLAVSAISNPKMNHTWGHVHNDKLSFELQVDGKDIVVDAGTYLYTAIPSIRNQFRSVEGHSVPYIEGEEQNRWLDKSIGLFYMLKETKCKVLVATNNELAIELRYRNRRFIRHIVIEENKVLIKDYGNTAFESHFNTFNLYSNGYGQILNS